MPTQGQWAAIVVAAGTIGGTIGGTAFRGSPPVSTIMLADSDGGLAYYGVIAPLGYFDAGTLPPDASSAPDSGTLDASDAADSGPDSGPSAPPDSGLSIDSGTGGGVATSGRWEPPGPTDAGGVPEGAQLTVANLTEPPVGGFVLDPQFPGVQATRLLPSGIVVYSQLRSLSDDGTLLFLFDTSAGTVARVYRFPSMVEVPVPASIAAAWGSGAPRWRPTTHQVIYYLGAPARLAAYDLDTGQQTILVTTPYQFASGSPVWEQGSDDGTWTAMFTYPDNLPAHAGSNRILAAVNMRTGGTGAVLNLHTLYTTACQQTTYGDEEFDWASPTPSGRYLAVGWRASGAGRCRGFELYDLVTGAFVRQLYQGTAHGSFAVQPDGTEVYVTAGMSPLNGGWPSIVVYPLSGAEPRYPRMYAWDPAGSALDHIGCNAPGTPWCVISGGGEQSGGPLRPGIGEIWMINYIDGTMRRLYHARAGGSGGGIDNYFHQAHANQARDGSRVFWTSDWNGSNVAVFTIPLR